LGGFSAQNGRLLGSHQLAAGLNRRLEKRPRSFCFANIKENVKNASNPIDKNANIYKPTPYEVNTRIWLPTACNHIFNLKL
jgi:hypothetical protein